MKWLLLASTARVVLGLHSFSTGNWQGALTVDSGVLYSLKPKADTSFDFSPSDFYGNRTGTGQYHTGDIAIRWRQVGQSGWTTFDTAQLRPSMPVSTQPTGFLLSSNFSKVSPAASGPLSIRRDWSQQGADLVLQATVALPASASAVELGSFGFPIEFNSIFTGRTPDDTTAKCSLIDPYIGLDAGYVQVTRLTGTGPNLVVTPFGNTTKFEGWRFLTEPSEPPLYYQSQVFEGFYSWEVYTKAYAENEWSGTQPWNPPTSVILQPGQSIQFGLRFTPAQSLPAIEPTVASVGIPVAVGLPGYVLPSGLTGSLYLNHTSKVSSISASPAGLLTITPTNVPNAALQAYSITVGNVTPQRALVTIVYADGKIQTVNYFLTATQPNTANNFADFHFGNSFVTDPKDPFGRYGIITYDSEVRAPVLQDPRVWIAGQADEAGSVYEGVSLKESALPEPKNVARLEDMVAKMVWGLLQNSDYSVKRSLFYYDPTALPNYTYSSSINWGGSWSKSDSYSTWRAYDYVHASSIYYSLYRAERSSPGILKQQNATWYLTQAAHTMLQSQVNTAYGDDGLMGETIWVEMLKDLKAEGITDLANQIETTNQNRLTNWASLSQPYGSEMAWDSTGQEGVYAWGRYFNNQVVMQKTLSSIRGYMPTVAHWGWNGNARRYWDFLYGGKLPRIERMIHHYGSSLNALPLLDNYKYLTNPASAASFYDLRVGYAGNTGPLSLIGSDGTCATAFHSWPDTMKRDGYSGDFGPSFLGHIVGSATYLVQHADYGWVAMGGNVVNTSPSIVVKPKDTVRRSIYVAAAGLAVQFDAAQISQFTWSPKTNQLTVSLVTAPWSSPNSTIMTWQSTLGKSIALTTTGLGSAKGGTVVPVPGSVTFQMS